MRNLGGQTIERIVPSIGAFFIGYCCCYNTIIWMSVLPCTPYADRFEDDGATIIYEELVIPHANQFPEPKVIKPIKEVRK